MSSKIDLVLPQYYEWHYELEIVCKDTGVQINADEAQELFPLASSYIRIGPLRPEQVAAYPDKPKLATAVVAYVRAMSNSHYANTRFWGEVMINQGLYETVMNHTAFNTF